MNIQYQTRNNLLIWTTLFSGILLVSSAQPLIPLFVLVLIISFLIIEIRSLIPIITILLIALPSDIGSVVRTGILDFCFLILLLYSYQNISQIKTFYLMFDSKLKALILFLFLSMLVSTLFSNDIYIGAIEILRQFVFFLVVVVIGSYIKSESKNVDKILSAMVWAGVLVSVPMLIEIFKSGWSAVGLILIGTEHFSGYFNNVSALGGVLTISIPASVYFLVGTKLQRWIKQFIALFVIIQIFSLFLTNSRGAILGVFVFACVYFITQKKTNLKKIIPIVMAITIIIIIFLVTNETFNLYFRTTRVLENTRYLLWSIAFNIFYNYPIVGIGPGMFPYYMYRYLPVMLGTWDEKQIRWVHDFSGAGHAHNFILMKLTELGVVGLLISMFLLGYILKISYSAIKDVYDRSNSESKLNVIIFSTFCGLFARSFVEATGLFTNGWISRDLPFWLFVLIMIQVKNKVSSFNNHSRILS